MSRALGGLTEEWGVVHSETSKGTYSVLGAGLGEWDAELDYKVIRRTLKEGQL